MGVAVVACGGVDEVAAELLSDAGQVVTDAGQVIADAGAWLDSKGDASAQQDAAVMPRHIESTCPVQSVDGAQTRRYATFDVDADDVAQIWACDNPQDHEPCDPSYDKPCTGDAIPKPECRTWSGFTAGGKLWVACNAYARVRVTLR